MLRMTTNDDQAAERCQMDFTSDPKCVSVVRCQVIEAISKWGCPPEDIDRAVLICSELATNAIQHGHSAGSQFVVGLVIDGSSCLIEVSDSGAASPRLIAADSEDEHGRGLALVTALADGMGYRLDEPCGKTVWARLTLDSEGFGALRCAEGSAGL